VDVWAVQRSNNIGYSQPRHLPVPEAAIQAFHITMNSPLLQSASSKQINSLILPDVRFGTVSLD